MRVRVCVCMYLFTFLSFSFFKLSNKAFFMPRSRTSPTTSGGSSHSSKAHHNPPAPHSPARPATNAKPSTEQPQVTNVYLQRGGGGPGLMGTLAASAGGAIIGHGLSNYLYGGNTVAPTQAAEAQTLAKEASAEGHVCAPQLTGYSLCLENSKSSEDCKWAWDYFLQCQKSQTPAV